jgi:hypothetical protein
LEGNRIMPKLFYSLGYNIANSASLKLSALKINEHEYHFDNYEGQEFNLTSWWTPSMETNIFLKFNLEIDEIFADCLLDKDDKLHLVVYSYCPGTKLQHQSSNYAVDINEIEATLVIPANELAEDMTLNAVLTTRFEDIERRKVGSPHVSNSKILMKSWKFLLAGSRTQANIVLQDFSQTPHRARAMWQIRIHENLDMDSWLQAQHSNILRIEVNRSYEDFIQQPLFQIPMMTDLVMLALDHAIRDDDKLDFLQTDSIPESTGTWARFVRTMYLNLFSTGQIGVRQKWVDEQDFMRTRIQNMMAANLEIT